MDLVAVIRHKVHAEGVPIREIARELGLSRNTIRRYARAKKVPIDRTLPDRATPTRDAIAEAAAAIWQSRRSFTAGKQRLTATRLWELLRDAGHTASERTVRRLVAEFRSAEREVTVPLVYGAGEVAQVDFFEVWVELAGVRQKAWLFLMRLMHSGRDFTMLCAQQDATWFLAAHVAAFQHFAGVVAATACTVTFALGDETACHRRVPFGGRSVDYRHLLVPLSRKPQALRQVAGELVAQFGAPWPALWEALRTLHSPDEIEAARRLAPWLERADRQGLGRPLSRAITQAIAEGSLVPTPRRSVGRDAPTNVPLALQIYAVEGPDLSRYDALARASA